MQDSKKPPKKPYAALTSSHYLGSENTFGLPSKNFKKLQSQCLKESERNLDKALDFTAQMAILYGAPGLVMRFEIYKKIIANSTVYSDEPIDRDILHALRWLVLAQKLCENDPLAQQMMKHYLPEVDFDNPNYWRAQQQEIFKLANIPSFFNNIRSDIELTATRECDECIASKKPS